MTALTLLRSLQLAAPNPEWDRRDTAIIDNWHIDLTRWAIRDRGRAAVLVMSPFGQHPELRVVEALEPLIEYERRPWGLRSAIWCDRSTPSQTGPTTLRPVIVLGRAVRQLD